MTHIIGELPLKRLGLKQADEQPLQEYRLYPYVMIHRRRLTRFIVVLLLATLPCLALAGFARETRSGCAMQMTGTSDHNASGMAEHCQHAGHVEQLSPATGTVCKGTAHCSKCDDVSLSLAVSDALPARHAPADGVVLLPLDQLLSSTVAGFWRPPRAR